MNDVIAYWNRGAEELYGWTPEQAIGKSSHELLRTVFPSPLDDIRAELVRTGRWESELKHTKADGTGVVVSSRWCLRRDEREQPLEVLETNNDITVRKRKVTRVDTQAALLASLEKGGIDLILADYSLPSFDGICALKLAMKACPDVPFIFVSGTLGEEVATEALKIGATDYVLKTRLSRLVPSVVRALREARERAERKQADENLRRSEAYLTEAQRLSHTGSFGCTPSTGEMFWSEETFRIYGYDQSTKPTVEHVLQRVHLEDKPYL